jgi:hypothetical protein
MKDRGRENREITVFKYVVKSAIGLAVGKIPINYWQYRLWADDREKSQGTSHYDVQVLCGTTLHEFVKVVLRLEQFILIQMGGAYDRNPGKNFPASHQQSVGSRSGVEGVA